MSINWVDHRKRSTNRPAFWVNNTAHDAYPREHFHNTTHDAHPREHFHNTTHDAHPHEHFHNTAHDAHPREHFHSTTHDARPREHLVKDFTKKQGGSDTALLNRVLKRRKKEFYLINRVNHSKRSTTGQHC
jgi:hypothetical protein